MKRKTKRSKSGRAQSLIPKDPLQLTTESRDALLRLQAARTPAQPDVIAASVVELLLAARRLWAQADREAVTSYLAVADKLAEAKAAYEAETGTGHGKRRKSPTLASFVELAAQQTGRSTRSVERFLQIQTLDKDSRLALTQTEGVTQEVMELVVRTPERKRPQAIRAFATQGTPALRKLIQIETKSAKVEKAKQRLESDQKDNPYVRAKAAKALEAPEGHVAAVFSVGPEPSDHALGTQSWTMSVVKIRGPVALIKVVVRS